MVVILSAAALGYRHYYGYNKGETGNLGVSDNMVTSFQDPSGWFYECSQPIPAEWANVPHLSGRSSRQLVASNPEDVKRYCHQNGIE